ncbi:hypothetical protein AVEN_95618-1 [Araneus ventricosus]|uniref:Uncharacterized protein n=1 Tax=Araneus ventricosus TaxID=182803 RepID=A0A4Y2IJ64_ARAVE|nr:hypothetical protein AVEN_95618-1 [Araneus ventricosus]
MDRTRWPNCLATEISRLYSTGFFLLGYAKDKVYSRKIREDSEPPRKIRADLRVSAIAAIATVTTEMLQRTWLELDYRLDILRTTKVAHVEECTDFLIKTL